MVEQKRRHLGIQIADWAELIEGAGGNAKPVYNQLVAEVQRRNMPSVLIAREQWRFGSQDVPRLFVVANTAAGFTSVVCVREHGDDLYVSWRMYRGHKTDWKTIFWAFIFTALLISISITWESLLGYLFTLTLWLVGGIVILSIAVVGVEVGINRRIPVPTALASIKTPLNWAVAIVCAVLGFIMGILYILSFPFPSLQFPWPLPGVYIVCVIGIFLFLVILGDVTGDPLGAFVEGNTAFDADDALAMGFAVHQSLLRALDQAGVDTAQLTEHGGAIKVIRTELI